MGATDRPPPLALTSHGTAVERRRILGVAVLRMVGVAVGLLTIYFLIPFDRASAAMIPVVLAVAVVIVSTVNVLLLRSVNRGTYPMLRGVEALVTSLLVLVVTFAQLYLILSSEDPGAFDEVLDHVGALYFTLTTLTTIGYGDIAPVTDAARIVVMVHMVVNVVVVVVFVRLVVRAVRERLQADASSNGTPAG
jgi:hypothetical protein